MDLWATPHGELGGAVAKEARICVFVYSRIEFKKQMCKSCMELYYFDTAEVVEGRDVADYAGFVIFVAQQR